MRKTSEEIQVAIQERAREFAKKVHPFFVVTNHTWATLANGKVPTVEEIETAVYGMAYRLTKDGTDKMHSLSGTGGIYCTYTHWESATEVRIMYVPVQICRSLEG